MTSRILAAFLALCTLARAEDHRVANLAEFKTAASQAQPGDTITLREGEWKDADLLLEAQGTAASPITLRAANPGKTIVTGQSRLRFGGDHLIVSGLFFRGAWHKSDLIEFRRDSKKLAHDCRLTNCALVDCNAPEGRETRWIGLYGQRNRVDHCWIEGKTTKGTTLVVWLNGEPTDHRIDHNFFGPRPRLGQNGGETIRVGDSKTSMQICRAVVEANCFERCDGEAEIISNKSCGNLYRGNTFLRCSGSLTLRHGNDCRVEGNYFFGENASGSGGVRIIGERHTVTGNYFQDLAGDEGRAGLCLVNGLKNSPLNGYFQVREATITANTWIDCNQPVYIGQSDEDTGNSLPVQKVLFRRNLISGKTPAVIIHTPGDVSWEDNVVHPSAAPDPALPGLRALAFELTTGPVRQPAGDGPSQGYGFTKTADGEGPLRPEDTGPEWR